MTSLVKRGSSGAVALELQALLNAAGAVPQLLVDGDFGAETDVAVRAFQATVVDGIAGPQTLTALKQATAARSGPYCGRDWGNLVSN